MPIQFFPLKFNSEKISFNESAGSNAFTYPRFLTLYLMNFQGRVIFADGDMICKADIAKLWKLRELTKAVQVVRHDYKTRHLKKYLGNKNEDYPRKNWSSLILWNCAHPIY